MDLNGGPASMQLDLVTGQTGLHAPRLTVEVPDDDLVSYLFSRRGTVDPDSKIFVNAEDERDFVTYDQAFYAIEDIASRLRESGLKVGDCVCIHSFNHIHYPLFWLGVVAAGGVVTGSNPAYTTQELVHHLKITSTKLIIVHADRLASILPAAERCHIALRNIYTFGNDEASTNDFWGSTYRSGTGNSTKVAPSDRSTQDSTLAAYAATSGTTGLPKAARLSHRYFVAQLAAVEGLYGNRNGPITQLHCLPVFHAFAAPVALLLPLRLGITTYYLPRFNAEHYAEAVHRFQITDTAVVPPIIATLCKLPQEQHVLLQSLRFMICAGAPLATAVQANLGDLLHPELAIVQCWGCTEVGWISTFYPYELDLSGSVGYLLPNTTLKIVGTDHNILLGDGHAGEAYIKSESMFQGYQTKDRRFDKSELCDDEGFYATGDVVYIKRGRIYIKGRIKDIMKVNGWQVSPDEIQAVIMQLGPRGILDCAVVGSTAVDANGLQVTMPRAYVVKSADSLITADAIRAHVKKELVSYKQITSGVMFVDQIPRNATGKILRRLLEEPAAEQHARDDIGPGAVLDNGLHHPHEKILWFVIGPLMMLVIAWYMDEWF